MEHCKLIRCGNSTQLAASASRRFLKAQAARKPASPFCLALSGGRIAQDLFSAVADEALARRQSFAGIHFFWGDERCVPPTDAESNFAAADQLLFQPLDIPENQIHCIRGEQPPAEAAREAAAALCRFAPLNAAGLPVLDLVFLGMGEDGHVASLFPGESEAVMSSPAIYRPVIGPKPPPRRITLGYGVIATAKEVWVLASGAGKAAALRESLSPAGKTPLARVLQARERTLVFTDIRR